MIPSVTVLWSMIIASCATAAGFFLLLGWPYRTTPAAPAFAVLLAATGGIAYCELWMMRAETVEEYGVVMQWAHVPTWIAILALMATIRASLGAGRIWLAWTVCAVRTLALAINFATPPNLNFREIVALSPIPFLGDTVVRALGTPNPWMLVGQIGLLLLIVFIADAVYTVWRRGDPKRKRLVAVALLLNALGTSVHTVLTLWGVIQHPIMISTFFLFVIVAMGADLSYGLLDVNRWAARLRESEEYSSLAMNAGGIGSWTWIIRIDRFRGSTRWRDLFGVRRATSFSSRQILQRIHRDDRPGVRKALERTRSGGGEFTIEFRLLSPASTVRWIEARGRFVPGSRGMSDRILGVVIDITERKAAEERFRQLVEASPTGVMLVTHDGKIALVNSLVESILGAPREELIGAAVASLLHSDASGESPDWKRQFVDTSNSRPASAAREIVLERKDGTRFPAEIASSAVKFGEENLVLVSIVDITLRKQTEQDLEQKRNQLARMSRVTMLGELSGSLAHELNQPLASILSNAQAARRFLAQDTLDLDELRAIVNDIIAEDRRAGEIIRRMRRLLEKGDVQHQQISMNLVLQEVLQLLRSDLSNRSITVNVDTDPKLPETSGDHVQLQQVLLNLVLNAADAISGLPVEDRVVTLRTAVGEDGSIQLSVSDHGPGIAAESLEEVFAPFYTTKPNGMGLGLAVCRNIVTAHHGRLWATQNEGRGATFHLTLPAAVNS